MMLAISLLSILVCQVAAQLKTLSGHTSSIRSLAITGDYLFSGSWDYTIKQWSISTGELIRTFTGHTLHVYSVAISGDSLFSGSGDSTIKQWSISTGDEIRTLTGHTAIVRSFAVSGDSLFSASSDSTIKQWSISTGELIQTFVGHTATVYTVAVNGDNLFSGSYDWSTRQWSISSGVFIRNFVGHSYWIFTVATDGDSVFASGAFSIIRQWSISSGSLIRNFTGHNRAVYSLAVEGDYLYSGSDDRTIRQWSISSGRLIRTFTGHTSAVYSVELGGDFLFSGSSDNTTKQWCAGNTYQNGSRCIQCPNNAQCSVANFTCNSGYYQSAEACYLNNTITATLPTTSITGITLKTQTTETFATTQTTETFATTQTTKTFATTQTTETLQTFSTWFATEIIFPKTSSTTQASSTDLSTPSQPPDNPSPNMITFIAVGGTVLAVILAVGIFTASLYYGKRKASQQRLRSTEALNNCKIMDPIITSSSPSVFGGQNYLNEMSIRKIFPTYNNYVVNDTADPSHIMSVSDISSAANYNQLYTTSNTFTKNAPYINNTTTMFTNSHQGLYVPGHFLLRSGVISIRPISCVLHSNSDSQVQVCQVLDTELRQRCRTDLVAVKTLHGMDQNNLTCFYQEISIMYYFRGKPNIAQLVGFCDSPYQVLTDYYSLGSLAQALLLDSRVIEPCKLIAIQFSLQISGALEQMHQNGFSHSDIKALNVFVDRDRDRDHGDGLQCYLGDFGLAQILDDTHLVVKSYRVLNRKGLTAAYAAPEMLKRFRGSGGENASEGDWKAGDFLRADIHSLGVLLYEIVCCLVAWK